MEDSVTACLHELLGQQAQYQQSNRINTQEQLHVNRGADRAVILGIIKVHIFDHAQIVESAYQRHQHRKHHQHHKACLQGGLQHGELGVEASVGGMPAMENMMISMRKANQGLR